MYARITVRPGAPVSQQPKEKLVGQLYIHEMKGDRDGKSAKTSTQQETA